MQPKVYMLHVMGLIKQRKRTFNENVADFVVIISITKVMFYSCSLTLALEFLLLIVHLFIEKRA